jgi:nucleotide-binding universal stress UspA family protein
MSYKSIVVHINSSKHVNKRIAVAAALARQCEAHLIGLAALPMPQPFYTAGADDSGAAAMVDYMAWARERAEAELAACEQLVGRLGVASFEQRLALDDATAALCLETRYADLLVLGQDDPCERSNVPDTRAAYLLHHVPCPVLFVPYAGDLEKTGQNVVVAWNGSIEASRAIAAAIPVLVTAASVRLVVFNPDAEPGLHGEQPGADMALQLARHGVHVEVVQRSTGPEMEVGQALLSYVAESGADLLVMGAFTHSHFREWWFGGVTRRVLTSMMVPVLMAH